MSKERVIGVLNTYTSTLHTFDDKEIKIMQAIANQAAVAIEHTRLMEKSFEMQEALTVQKTRRTSQGLSHAFSQVIRSRCVQVDPAPKHEHAKVHAGDCRGYYFGRRIGR